MLMLPAIHKHVVRRSDCGLARPLHRVSSTLHAWRPGFCVYPHTSRVHALSLTRTTLALPVSPCVSSADRRVRMHTGCNGLRGLRVAPVKRHATARLACDPEPWLCERDCWEKERTATWTEYSRGIGSYGRT